MTVEEGDVETLGLVGTQEVDMAMINRGVVVEAVVGVEKIRMQVLQGEAIRLEDKVDIISKISIKDRLSRTDNNLLYSPLIPHR
jgi:hypothetical protein